MWRSKTRTRHSIRMLATLTSLALSAGVAAADTGWDLLGTAVADPMVTGNKLTFEKNFPDELVAAAEGFEIEGFYVPVEAQAYIQSFLIVEDPADCPFCGGAGYGPVLEVYLDEPMKDRAEFSLIGVRGTLEFVDDPETLQMFRLVGARVLPGS